MANISSLVNLNALSVFYERMLNVQPPYLGETYFDNIKVSVNELKYYIQKQTAPVLAGESAPDVNSTRPANYGGFDDELFKTRFFRNSGTISEQDLMDINEAMSNNDDQLLQTLITNLFQDQARQLLSHRARREWMNMCAFTLSMIPFQDSAPVTYKSDPDFQKQGNDWNNPDADIFADIRSATDAMRKKGIYPNQIVMNINTFRNMQKNNKIKETFSFPGANTNSYMMLENNLVDAIKSEFHIYPVVYDQGYVDNTGTFNGYIPDNLVILVNGPIDSNYTMTGSTGVALNQIGNTQTIGHMAFAPTPEELKSRNGTLGGDLQLFDTGVAFHTFDDQKLAVTESSTTQNCLPSFEQSRSVFRMKVGPQSNSDNGNNNGGQTANAGKAQTTNPPAA